MRSFIISLLLISMMSGGYFSDNFLKFSTLYGSASVSSPIKPQETISFTGSEIQEETTNIDYDYNFSVGIRKIARFGYEQKLKNFYDGSEKVGNESVVLGAVPGWEYLFKYSKLRQFGNEFNEKEYWLRYVGSWFALKGQYSEFGQEELTFGQFDVRYRKELGGFDFTTGLAFRGRPIVINPEINWEEEFGNAWWELAYSQGWTDQWYWISEEDGTGDFYWYNPAGELVTDTDSFFYDNIFEGLVNKYHDSFIIDHGWQWETILAIGLDFYHYADNWWLHSWATILPVHYGITEFADVDDRGIDHDVGIIFGWKLTKHLGVFTEGRHLSYFNVDDEKNEYYDFKAGLNYVFF